MKNIFSDIKLPPGRKIFFASDFHLGAPSVEESIEREKKVVSWLSSIQHEAHHIFILGDIFDFWFEYRYTIPRGFTRLLGKLMELRDQDIPITFFTGNHDMWMFGYFNEEFNIPVFRHPASFRINNKDFMIGHGDGLGPGDPVYKILKKIFENRLTQWMFTWIHPNIGFRIANAWSGKSRNSNLFKDQKFLGENEKLYQYCKKIEMQRHYDFYIFGHRHLPLNIEISSESRYINLGDWINSFTYAVFDGEEVKIRKYEA